MRYLCVNKKKISLKSSTNTRKQAHSSTTTQCFIQRRIWARARSFGVSPAMRSFWWDFVTLEFYLIERILVTNSCLFCCPAKLYSLSCSRRHAMRVFQVVPAKGNATKYICLILNAIRWALTIRRCSRICILSSLTASSMVWFLTESLNKQFSSAGNATQFFDRQSSVILSKCRLQNDVLYFVLGRPCLLPFYSLRHLLGSIWARKKKRLGYTRSFMLIKIIFEFICFHYW